MKPGRTDREAVRVRLEWLALLGVGSVRAGKRSGATPALTGARPDPRPSEASAPTDLFGRPTAAPEMALPGRGRSPRGDSEPRSSVLAGVRPPEAASPDLALAAIREEIGDCRRCRLCEKRTQVVFGVGSATARLIFVGEGPGADEDAQGEPFVGRAGQLLTKIIESMGMKRADVYIANIVKCRPPENRTPLPDEVATCSPFLFQQILSIRPRVMVCLGTPAAQTILGTRETITRLRGSFRQLEGIAVMPTFHPAYLLRNPAAKREVWEDMKQVMALLKSG